MNGEMVERVMRAIMDAADEIRPSHARIIARAAIEAMRQPTDAMFDAAEMLASDSSYPNLCSVWQAMIDVALNKTPEIAE